MGRKFKVTSEVKIEAVESYLKDEKSVLNISEELSVNKSSVRRWICNYKTFGASGLIYQSKNATYDRELKMAAIEDYLDGEGSLVDIRTKYGLRSESQLITWIMHYNSHKDIESSGTGGNQSMTKGRQTTTEERIETVKYCIENSNNYNETAKKFKVSYQQVRSWTMKYEESGVDGLLDRRGKRKPEAELNEVEKMKAEYKLLEAKNKRLEIENALLKKLEEIERR